VGTNKEWGYDGKSKNKVGIVFDPAHYHKYFMAACIDMQVSYEVIDIRKNDWIEIVNRSGCNAIVVWPLLSSMVLKEMVDERLRLINDNLRIEVYPPPGGVWLLDNKRRVRDWLMANGFDVPATWCFFTEEEANEFTAKTSYPIVFKTVRGSVSLGVVICRKKEEARKLIRDCFGKGVLPERSDPRNRQWDFVMFQEYLPEVEEKRMIRIGESYLCIDKVRIGDFHSGSGHMKWGNPEAKFLGLIKDVTEKGKFPSMNVDFFIARDGRILVNELHTLFHGPVVPDSDLKGRYLEQNGGWKFEQGNYYRNYCCNLRMENLLRSFNEDKADFTSWVKLPAF
jgi:hypothetical protein